MIDTSMWLEKFLQDYRFSIILPYLKGDVLDFGGNKGELKRYVSGNYMVVNYDHTPMLGKKFDTIVSLAVIEHIDVEEVNGLFILFRTMLNGGGSICITTPAPASKPVLETLSSLGLVDRANIEEHKHYWSRSDLERLAKASGLLLVEYRPFQFGFNQLAVFVDGGFYD